MSLSQQSIDTIKATYPLIKEKGIQITEHMYQLLFVNHPECQDLFLQSSEQPKKLAHAMLAFISHVDDLDQIASVLDHIAQKHVASQVKAIHYPLVAGALLSSMQAVLGRQVFNAQVMEAWSDAYLFLASYLMSREAEIYANSYHQEVV